MDSLAQDGSTCISIAGAVKILQSYAKFQWLKNYGNLLDRSHF